MPLKSGSSAEVRSENIAELRRSGYPAKQAEAIAYRKAGEDEAQAAGILLRSPKGNALFLKRRADDASHPGEWCCPGGGIEAGETPEQAAHRETQEEVGYTSGDLTRIDEGDGFVTFGANVDAEFDPTLNGEHTEFRWAPLDAPPEPTHPGVIATLKKLLGKAIEAGERESKAEQESVAAGKEESEAQRQAQALLATDALDRREYDDNGWFTVYDNPISSVGVFQYSEASLVKGGDRNKMVGVYRPAEELGSEECIKSFHLMPWTDDHPATLLGDESKGLVPAEKKGVHGVIGEKVYFKDGTLYGNLKIWSESLAGKLPGKRELSCGYHCDFVPQEGVYKGKPYQYVQRNMRGNHVSSVKAGRMGAGVRVLDAADAADSEFAAATRFTFSLDMREPEMPEMRKDEKDCSLDADTAKFIEDSFNSLVGELEKKGYSKEYATKVAGKVAAEKGMTGHHDSKDSKVTTMSGTTAVDSKVKDETEEERKKREAADARGRARDEESDEEEADEKEAAKDAAEEKEDEKKDDKEARDRGRARDRRAGARDARRSARDGRRAARDKAAKDAEEERKKAEAAKDAKKGMDAAEVTALVKKEVAATAMDAAQVAALIRKDETAKHRLYQRLSPIVGAFDHDEMSHADMAAYGVKRIGIKTNGDSMVVLDAYLEAVSAARDTQPQSRQRAAHDSASDDSFVGKYINGAAA